LSSCALRPAILPSYILPSCLFIRHLLDFRSTFIRPSLDICLTSVWRMCVTGHSQQHIVFFKLYVVSKFYS
jgi:hypothetical protein